ncbi:hypothetical protein VTN00DRAFT_6660 [Thermoascus crustaceus]|uniref:uncharacterized protein n=1 Tax=Thermoascus crustaceus TaxID=5088 RepID=UPI0037426E66
MATPAALPDTYSSLPFKEIAISHVPAAAPSPTKAVLLKLKRAHKFNAVTKQIVEELVTAGGRIALAIHNCCKPTVMAINSPAAEFGITMTLPATIRVACGSSKISFAFARHVFVTEVCSSYFLPKLVGMECRVRRMLVTTGATYAASDPPSQPALLRRRLSRVLAIAGEIAAQYVHGEYDGDARFD